MRRLYLGMLKTIIALLIFMTAAAPLYSQELQTHQPVQSAGDTPAQTSDDSQQRNTTPLELADNSQQVEPSQPDPSQTTTSSYTFPTKRQRFNRYVFSTIGPFSLLRTGAAAGIGQWRDEPEEWGQGASGYGKRFASGFGQNTIQQTVIYGLDQALGLDTGFQKSKRKGFFPRLKHTLAESFTSRTRTGKRVISVPRIAGVYAGGIIAAETWYPSRYNYKDGLRNGSYSLASGFGINLIREFIVNW